MRVVDANLQTPFDSDTQAHINRMTGPFDAQLLFDLDALIRGLKTDSLWDKIAILCVVQRSNVDSLLNLKGNSTDADSVVVSGSSFSTNRGFTCNSSLGDYLDLVETESSCSLYSLHDSHIMVYSRTNNDTTGVRAIISGDTTESYCEIDYSGTDTLVCRQNSASAAINVSGNTPKGFFGVSCAANDDRHVRANDTSNTNRSLVSGAALESVDTIKAGALADGTLICNEQLAAWGVGEGLTITELALYEDRIRTYMQARGADVY